MTEEIETCQKLASSSFQASDLGLSILIWIPFFWWLIPLWLIISPFCGTYWRKKYYKNKK